jgi:Kef-type K+ transport system membrane component KefB
MMRPVHVDPYLQLLGLIALLFFLPKGLLRLGIPSPVTEMTLGVVFGPLVLGFIEPSDLLEALSGLGISALFLFAGLEVSIGEILERKKTMLQHVVIQIGLFAVAAWVAFGFSFESDLPRAVLIAAAVMSPSAAFIIPALESLGLSEDRASWVKQKAISTELLAILVVLLFSNSASTQAMLIGFGGIVVLMALVPLAFVGFHKTILKWAPRTEFSFVMILALLAAYFTHHLGVHYLVGGFVVGLVARRYLRWCQKQGLAVAPVRSALTSFRFFSAFLMPFFFFLAGMRLPPGALSVQACLFAGAMLLLALPLRVGSVMVHRRIALKESWGDSWNVGLLLAPTTVFSVAMAEILMGRFTVSEWVIGGLVLYGAATSFVPLLTHKVLSTEYEDIMVFGEGVPAIRPGSGFFGGRRAAMGIGDDDFGVLPSRPEAHEEEEHPPPDDEDAQEQEQPFAGAPQSPKSPPTDDAPGDSAKPA